MSVRGDAISHSLLTTLYRYLCGYGDALLQDSALHRIVYGLMTKLFKKLVIQFRKLGALIVYANFSRMIINTKKYEVSAAVEYVDFIISAIRSHETFSYIEVDNHLNIICFIQSYQ
jgi:DNA polymerase epsilon subunit 1